MALPVHNADPSLLGLFAAEAEAHLADIGAALASLGQGRDGATLRAMLESLHTLGGAARAVDQFDLELLCRALERVFAAARDAGARCEPVARALELAPQLIGQPAGRIRNQALALCGQLDALATRLAQPSPTPSP